MTDLYRLHALDEHPPESEIPAASIDVLLVYADGHTERGYFSSWIGWVRSDEWVPIEIEHDADQPVGWRMP